jgi:hypothetical protein
MALNGISTLTFKRDRQDAKLAAAGIKRATTGRRSTLDITQLPTRYSIGDNFSGNLDDQPNIGGLVSGRPWTI